MNVAWIIKANYESIEAEMEGGILHVRPFYFLPYCWLADLKAAWRGDLPVKIAISLSFSSRRAKFLISFSAMISLLEILDWHQFLS